MPPPIFPDSEQFDSLATEHAAITVDITNLGATTRLGAINGIDRGEITVNPASENTKTATVGAVVMARSLLTNNGWRGVSNVYFHAWSNIVLTNTTTITMTAESMDMSAGHVFVASAAQSSIINAYELVEYAA